MAAFEGKVSMVVTAGQQRVLDVRVRRVGLVPVDGVDTPEYCQSWNTNITRLKWNKKFIITGIKLEFVKI